MGKAPTSEKVEKIERAGKGREMVALARKGGGNSMICRASRRHHQPLGGAIKAAEILSSDNSSDNARTSNQNPHHRPTRGADRPDVRGAVPAGPGRERVGRRCAGGGPVRTVRVGACLV